MKSDEPIRQVMRRIALIVMAIVLAACNNSPTPEATPTATRDLPPPQVFVTSVPKVDETVHSFLDAWKAEDYAAMYGLLSTASQASITLEQFEQRYKDATNEAASVGVDYTILGMQNDAQAGQVSYQVVLHSAIVGDIQRDTKMDLVLDSGQWRVNWNDSLILPELAGGNYLKMDSTASSRATIYDHNGKPLAAQAQAAAIGVWPDYVDLQKDTGLVSLLAALSNQRYDAISTQIEEAEPGAYIPLGEVASEDEPRRLESLSGWGAAVVSYYSRRLYYGNGIGPHITGYVSAIQDTEIGEYRRKGYRSDDRVGRKGLELWGETTLNGKRGGTLYVFNPDGKPVAELGTAAGEPGQDIYTTIDRDFQREVQKAMSVFTGAVVVLERDTGRVLAMASNPGFDPNAYEIENYNWNTLLNEIVTNPASPQFNRATQGQYPLGSVFKLITISAALESQRYTPETLYDCQYAFEELPGFPRYDWTYEHFQEDGVTQPSGVLNLKQGLIRSCNPYFWHIGLDLFNVGLTQAISNMARGFGLGSKTGIEGVDDEAGNIPDPGSAVDAINLAIGQGDTQVTPLQVARFVAAFGNGGKLYRPQLIERIASPGTDGVTVFKPELQGTLPIKAENLAIIREAMVGVVRNEKPRGTAYRAIYGLDIPVAGKTGTATAAAGDPHAWFAGYTFAEKADKPDIAIAVIAENAGEGSEIAAPIFRRVVELYFYGKPLKIYRWESAFDATREPTSPATEAPPTQPGFINP